MKKNIFIAGILTIAFFVNADGLCAQGTPASWSCSTCSIFQSANLNWQSGKVLFSVSFNVWLFGGESLHLERSTDGINFTDVGYVLASSGVVTDYNPPMNVEPIMYRAVFYRPEGWPITMVAYRTPVLLTYLD